MIPILCLATSSFAAPVQWLVALESQTLALPSAEGAVHLAQLFGTHRNLKSALRWTQQAQALGAHPLRVQMVRGDAYFHAEEYADAVREYYEVVLAAPDSQHAKAQLWMALRDALLPPSMDGQRIREGLRAAGYYLPENAQRPRKPAASLRLIEHGYLLVKKGQFLASIRDFQAAIAQDDTQSGSFRGLGIAYGRVGDSKKSIAAYRLYLGLSQEQNRETRQIERIILDAERHRGLRGARRSGHERDNSRDR